ncbi:MAG: acyloxyacyl hydrolase [Vicingaceae bacterium]|nr:acyloxyacyl hydrolase [Vicingaceae bacterium]
MSFAQETKKNPLFLEPEYMIGRVVPNYLANFPNTHLQHGLALSIGSFKTDTSSSWAKYYNFPQTGVSLFYSNIGNNKIFGNEFSAMTFVSFNVFNRSSKPTYLKIGIGAAYFDTYYDSITNPRNVDVGSPFTWSFQAGAYKVISEKDGMNLKLGFVFSHASNGHTQLPNFGLNSALLSLSAQFYNKDLKQYQLTKTKTKSEKLSKSFDVGVSYGLGFHEYGDKDGPVGTAKKGVHSTSVFVGRTKNNHFRWGVGGTYRIYEVYKQQIIENDLTAYKDNINKSASNIVLFTNVEFLMSHISIDVELGFNLYKPFYKQYEEDFPPDQQIASYSDIKGKIKRVIATRLGLNLYAFNTNKLPKHNFFIGPHIKANSGQADFTELAFGYVFRIN